MDRCVWPGHHRRHKHHDYCRFYCSWRDSLKKCDGTNILSILNNQLIGYTTVSFGNHATILKIDNHENRMNVRSEIHKDSKSHQDRIYPPVRTALSHHPRLHLNLCVCMKYTEWGEKERTPHGNVIKSYCHRFNVFVTRFFWNIVNSAADLHYPD